MLVNDLQHTDLHESYENAELVRTTLYNSPPEPGEHPELH